MNPNEITITPLPDSNEFEVPLTDGAAIATCEPHYVPTLKGVIAFHKAAGVDRTDLQEMLDVYLSEHRVMELDDSEPAEGDEPAEDDQEDQEEEPESDDPHSRTLDEVNDELNDLDDEEGEGPDYYEALKNHPWNYGADWTATGKEMLRDWMRGEGMSDRGRVPGDIQTKFALLYADNGALRTLLSPKAHTRFTRAYENVA
jgi:hypothetical protein